VQLPPLSQPKVNSLAQVLSIQHCDSKFTGSQRGLKDLSIKFAPQARQSKSSGKTGAAANNIRRIIGKNEG
jgi:hypothetical protein